jgi:hypothetical protein
VNFTLCCTWNCCQHFPCEKTKLFRQEFWGLSFEECKVYGMDIPRRLHVKANMKQWKFITIQEIDICEMAWYKIIGLSKSTYMLYKVNPKRECKFLPHGNKGSHKLWTPTKQAKSNVQSLINLSVNTMPHQLKGIENGRQDVQ